MSMKLLQRVHLPESIRSTWVPGPTGSPFYVPVVLPECTVEITIDQNILHYLARRAQHNKRKLARQYPVLARVITKRYPGSTDSPILPDFDLRPLLSPPSKDE